MFLETYETDGVSLADAFGTRYPEYFSHPLEEYSALTSRVGMIDLSHWGALRLTGADRIRLVNSMVTNDVAALGVGESCRAALTTIKGKLVADLHVLARENELLVLVAQGDRAVVRDTLDKHIIADDVTLEDISDATVTLAIEGTRARDLVWRLLPDAPLPLEPSRFIDAHYQDMPVCVLRNSVSGERGFTILTHRNHGRLIRNYLVQAGLGMDIALTGRLAWNMRRIENGLPWFGADVTGDNFPKESRLDDLVSYEKGCFLGQETLARMHHRGHPNWLLVGMVPGDTTPQALRVPAQGASAEAYDVSLSVPAGTDLFLPDDAEKPAGRITSGAFSPRLESPLFLGYVRLTHAVPDTRLIMTAAGESVPMRIISLPLEDNTK